MSSPQIAELSQRLQSALDSNYNVVDMATIIEVIGVLETAKITKEQLETTRLAKHINQLRRKTDDHMSKRLKNLLRKWREMVIPIVTAATQPLPHPQRTPHLNSNNNQVINNNNTNCNNLQRQPNTNHTVSPLSNGGHTQPSITQPHRSLNQQLNPPPPTPPLNIQATNSQINNNQNSHQSSRSLPQPPLRSTGGPISFTNLISQAEANQQHIHHNQATRKRTNNTLSPHSITPTATLPRIPKRNRTLDQTQQSSPQLHLFGNNTVSQQPPTQVFQVHPVSIDDDNSNNSLLMLDDANSNGNSSKRRRFNGPPSPTPCSSSFGIPSDSDSMSMLGPTPANTNSCTTSKAKKESTSSKHHKRDKKRRDKPPTALPPSSSSTSNTPNNKNQINNNANSSAPSSFFDAPNSLSSDSSTLLIGFPTIHPTTKPNTMQPSTQFRGVPLRKHQSSDLTFSGKFTKSTTTIDADPIPTTIINIDSSSSSSSSFSNGANTSRPLTDDDADESKRVAAVAALSNKARAFAIVSSAGSQQRSPIARPSHIMRITNATKYGGSRSCSPTITMMDSSSGDSSTLGLGDPKLLSGGESSSLPSFTMPPKTPTTTSIPGNLIINPAVISSPLAILASNDTSSSLPKKRGRKKGSNGITGNNNHNPPTTTAASSSLSHPFASSSTLLGLKNQIDSMRIGQNKVKTTKELLADLQVMRRQDTDQLQPLLNSSTTSSPVLSGRRSRGAQSQSTSDSDSSSNDDVRSTTATPVSLPSTAQTPEQPNNSIAALDALAQQNVENEIAELRAQLPPIDLEAVKLTEAAIAADLSPLCTCTVIEIAPQVEKVVEIKEEPKPDVIVVVVERPLTRASTPVAMTSVILPPPIQVKQPPVRSIFDLDYDEDEDPLLQYKAAALLHNERKLLREPSPPIVISAFATESLQPPASVVERIDSPLSVSIANKTRLPTPPLPPPDVVMNPIDNMPRLEVIEDPDCAARKHFVDNKNCITAFHVAELHNAYVANVNGNWDDRIAPGPFDDPAEENGVEPLLYDRVVPSYNHMCLDRIPKDLRHIVFGRALSTGTHPEPKQTQRKYRRRKPKTVKKKKLKKQTKKSEEVKQIEEEDILKNISTVPVFPPVIVKPKLLKTIKYKIQGANVENNGNPSTPPSTKLILKLSRQLTVDESNNDDEEEFDEDDSEYDEDYGEEDNYDDDENDCEYVHPLEELLHPSQPLTPHGFDCSDDVALLEPPQPMETSISTDNNNHINNGMEESAINDKCEAYLMPPNVRGLENRQDGDENEDEQQPPQRNGNRREPSENNDEEPAGPGNYGDDDDDDDDDGSSSSNDESTDTSSEDDEEDEDDNDDPEAVVIDHEENNNNNEAVLDSLPTDNNFLLPSFNLLDDTNTTGRRLYVPQYSPSNGSVGLSIPLISSPSHQVDASTVLVTTEHPDGISRYREWHEVVMRRSYNNELLTILPYVVID